MLRKLVLVVGATTALALPASAQTPATAAPTVDELIAKNIAARGGLDKLKAVQTMRMTGKLEVGPGMEAPVTMELKRPKSVRMDFTFEGLTAS